MGNKTNRGGGDNMNQHELPCGKKYRAVGQEGSLADLREKFKLCFNCSEINCKYKSKIDKEYYEW